MEANKNKNTHSIDKSYLLYYDVDAVVFWWYYVADISPKF